MRLSILEFEWSNLSCQSIVYWSILPMLIMSTPSSLMVRAKIFVNVIIAKFLFPQLAIMNAAFKPINGHKHEISFVVSATYQVQKIAQTDKKHPFCMSYQNLAVKSWVSQKFYVCIPRGFADVVLGTALFVVFVGKALNSIKMWKFNVFSGPRIFSIFCESVLY